MIVSTEAEENQPARGTNKGRERPQLAQVDDLLARPRCFKCGHVGHLARDCPENEDLVASSETFFSGMVCDEPSTDGDSRNETSTDGDSRNETSTDGDSRNVPCVTDDLRKDDETCLDFRKDDETFLEFRRDDETFPVLCSNSSSCSGLVTGPQEMQHSGLETGIPAHHI